VLHDVINQFFARKAIEKGADGLILVAAGAGGHAGTLSPFAFLEETRQWFDGPIVLSGAIGTGRAILAALAAGADLASGGIALINSIGNLGGFVGPYLVGLVKDLTGTFSGGLYLLAGFLFLAAAIVILLGHDLRLEQIPPDVEPAPAP
jgi:nitrate/nitrite transporter NarK